MSICDDLLIVEALQILHNFLTSPSLKHQIYNECHEQLCRSLELLYDGNAQVCKDKFREYLINDVVNRTEDSDNSLKKFFKSLLQKMSQEHSEAFLSSNLTDMIDKLG